MTKLALHSANGSIDLTKFLDVDQGDGMEPGDPSFTEKVFARSLLKKGATLTLEHLREKEQVFPLYLQADGAQRQNLAYDPSYEYDAVGAASAEWVIRLGAEVTQEIFAVSEAWSGPNGKKSLHIKAKHAANTTNTTCGAFYANTGNPATTHLIPVTPGERFTLQSLLNIIAGAANGFQFHYTWYKADSASVVTEGGGSSQFNGETGEKTLRDTTVTAPAEAAYLRVEIRAISNVSGATFEWYQDEVIVMRGTSVPYGYFDGDTSGYRWSGTAGDSISENYVGKEGLANLIQNVNLILNTPGCQVEWIDAGATEPTYFDLISGQLDDEFDFRLGEHNWLKTKLRLFSQPLGYWSQNGARQVFGIGAIAGSAAAVRASAPVAVFQASGLLDGDAPALVQGHLLKENLEGSYPYVAMSILPSASYSPLLPVASMTNGALVTKTASIIGAAEGVNGLAWKSKNLNVGSDSLNWRPNAGALPAYVGKHRIGVIARTPGGAAAAHFALFDPVGETYGPTQTAVATSTWTLYDLGTISRASSMLLYGAPYEVNVTMFSSAVASTILDVTAVIQLPDEQTVWLSGAQASSGEVSRSTNHFTFDGVNSRVALGLNPGVPASGIAPIPVEPERYPVQLVDLTGYVRGQIPEAPVTSEPPVFAFLYAKRFGAQNGSMVVNVNVLERTRYIF